MLYLLVCSVEADLRLRSVDGGGDSMLMLRHPFFPAPYVLPVNITSPTENTTYYDNNINITVDTPSTECYFRINSNDWNVLEQPTDLTTFPEGENTLYVVCFAGPTQGSDKVSFTVLTRPNISLANLDWSWGLGGLLLFWVLLLADDYRKKEESDYAG